MRTAFLSLFLILGLAACDTEADLTPGQAFLDARLAVEAGNGGRAMDLYVSAAERDHLKAQLALGVALKYGHFGVADRFQPSVVCRKDTAEARRWRERAFELASERSETGDPDARLTLANFLVMGMDLSMMPGVEEDPVRQAEGVAILEELENEGNSDAALQLGIIALIIEHDYEQAVEHYRRAVDLGHPNAYTSLGLVTGMLYPDDLAKGTIERIRVLREGAAAGNEDAIEDLNHIVSQLDAEVASGNADARELLDAIKASGVLEG